MTEHTVKSYEEELALLDKKIAQMGGLAEQLLGKSLEALERRDPKLAEEVVLSDRAIDSLEREIEEQVISMVARRQPMADDLRHVMGAMRITTDLERVGDLAKNVAKRVIAIGEQPSPTNLSTGLSALSERVGLQLSAVLKAYADRDDAAALAVWRADGEIDVLFTSLFRELLTYMMEDPRSIGFCTHLLFCAKNLERVGDHATNIAETAHYVTTGEALIAERPKGDDSSAIEPSLRPPQT
jgi:phosphate transport system protein